MQDIALLEYQAGKEKGARIDPDGTRLGILVYPCLDLN